MVGDNKEREGKGKTWHSLNEEDYAEARNSTDLLEFKYTMPDPDPIDLLSTDHQFISVFLC